MGIAADAALTSAASTPTAEPFRVLQVNSVLTGGGTDESCVRLVQVLRGMGHLVWVAGPGGSRYDAALEPVGLFCDPALRRSKTLFISHVARCIRRQQPQIVHAHHGRDYWPTLLALWLSRQPARLVLSRHLAKSPGAWVSRQFLLARCDAMVAVSEFVAKVLREGVYEPAAPEAERRSRPPMRGDKSKIFVAQGGIEPNNSGPWKMRSGGRARNWNRSILLSRWPAPMTSRGAKGSGIFSRVPCGRPLIPQARFLLIGRSLAETLQEDIQRLGLSGKAWLTPYCPENAASDECHRLPGPSRRGHGGLWAGGL